MEHISLYTRVKTAKASLKTKNRLGWPDTEDGIRDLFSELTEDEQTTILCGRFVRMWDNRFQFSFPATTAVIEVMEGLRPLGKEIVFKTDDEG